MDLTTPTFLDVYEAQIEWYLEHFQIPENYQEKILEDHAKLRSAYEDTTIQKSTLENRLARTKDLYEWGDITKKQYLEKKKAIERELRSLAILEEARETLAKLADFLSDVPKAWRMATQKQRNNLAKVMFEEVRIEDKKVVAVRPRPDLEPFFKMNFECQAKSIAGDPDGIRGLVCNTLFTRWRRFAHKSISSGFQLPSYLHIRRRKLKSSMEARALDSLQLNMVLATRL